MVKGDVGLVNIHCDTQNVIHVINYHIYPKRAKYINIRLHFVINVVESGWLERRK